ncbi:MAG: DNA cytosine methyltransferase [Solirubrobacterales bacterium]
MPANRSFSFGERPTAIDLFAGAGGLSLGLEQAGFDVLAAVEFDPLHAATHRFNFPATQLLCADATDIAVQDLRDAAELGWKRHGRASPWSGELDVLVGGPPCQGFSTGGKRRSDDTRNDLVFAYSRLVRELQPRYFIMENVQGLKSFPSSTEGVLLIDELIKDLRHSGYSVAEPTVLNACAFGVPQDRRRLFLMGARNGEQLPRAPKPMTRGRGRRPADSPPAGSNFEELDLCPSVSEAFGGLPELNDFDALLRTDEVEIGLDVVTTMDEQSVYVRRLRQVQGDPHDFSYPRLWDPGVLTSSRRTVHTSDVEGRFAETMQGSSERVSRFFRLHRDGVAPTLRAGTHYERGSFNAPRPIHPTIDRVISVREAARLHSYPDWFRFHWTKWHGFRQVGNSVPPLVGRAVAASVRSALSTEPISPIEPIDLGDQSLLRLENAAAAEIVKAADPSRMPRSAQRVRVAEIAA